MNQKRILAIFGMLLCLISMTQYLIPYAVLAEVEISKPYALRLEGDRMLTVGINTQVLLQVDMENKNDESQQYVIIVEVRDSNDITYYLQFQKGLLSPNAESQIGISWTPDKIGNYQVRSFVLSSFENPLILSPTSLNSVKVGMVSELDPVNDEDSESEADTTYYPDKEPTLYNLRQYALERINEDRARFGLPEVQLSENLAAQIHAEDNLKTRYISHWMSNGEKPYMTYTRYGGLGNVAQNIAMSGDYYYYKDCTSSRYYCEGIEPFKEIDQHQYGLMYEDKECCDNGHRDNILDKHHTHVSIGIAYDDYNFVMVQNFEGNHVKFDETIAKDSDNIRLSGEIPSKTDIYGIYIYYDENPTPEVYEKNKDMMSYDSGQLVAGVTTADYYYGDDMITITADRWVIAGNSIDISFDLEPAGTEDGVYTVMLILEDEDAEPFPVTSYSVFR